jgi:hypothetical protein
MFVEGLGWCLPSECLARPVVEGSRDRVELVLVVAGQVGPLREVLAQQPVRVLIGAPLPGTVWVAEVDRDAGFDAQLSVLGHLGALVPRSGSCTVARAGS